MSSRSYSYLQGRFTGELRSACGACRPLQIMNTLSQLRKIARLLISEGALQASFARPVALADPLKFNKLALSGKVKL